MSNVSTLLVDNALLKLLLQKSSFSIGAFKTLPFHKVVSRQTWCGWIFSDIVLLQMFSWLTVK